MADNERQKKNYPPRKSQQYFRPPPGVQKAIQSLGVTDLREILDKKRQEHGESQDNKKPDSNPPPPDPSYNYLKDPTRDRPSDRPKPQKRSDNERHQKHSDRDTPHFHRDNVQEPKDRRHQDKENKYQGNPEKREKPRDRDTSYFHRENVHETKDRRQQDNGNKLQGTPEKGVLRKNQNSPHDEGETKKELRFVEPPRFEEQPTRGGRHSFRGRNARRGGGMPRESVDKKIENPINIKIELSTQTGQRNCILDENTKIADIKHVPDTPIQKYTRGGFRGSRSSFRSRGRGRGSFRGRGGFRKDAEYSKDAKDLDNNFSNEKSQRPKHDEWDKGAPPVKTENARNETSNSSFEQNSLESNEVPNDYDGNQESYEEYDQENEEYGDASEHYNEEFSNEYQSEYENGAQKLDDGEKCEPSIMDPKLNETITITSSKFQDGEVKRSIDITENTKVADENQTEKRAEE